VTVLIDIGNTRMKWARLQAGALVDSGSALHTGGFGVAMAAMFDALAVHKGPSWVANVAGDSKSAQLTSACTREFGQPPHFVTVAAEAYGIRCAYALPERLGVDRWIAMIGAYRLAGGPVCVIDAGTTVTFDAVDAQGMHLGGLILAGPRMSASILDRGTQGVGPTLAAGARPRGLDLLGRSTDTAVAHAALLSISTALDEAVRAVAAALGETPVCLMTGGDGPLLKAWLETEVQTRADLVLEGLAFIAGTGH
jgi:type III pantothenate kinase